MTVPTGPCPSASEERGKGDCNLRCASRAPRRGASKVGGKSGVNHGREGQGRIAPLARGGLVGPDEEYGRIVSDLKTKLQKWQGKGEPPAGEVGKAVQRVETSWVLLDGIPLNLRWFTIPVLQRDGALTPARSPVDLEPQLPGFDGHRRPRKTSYTGSRILELGIS